VVAELRELVKRAAGPLTGALDGDLYFNLSKFTCEATSSDARSFLDGVESVLRRHGVSYEVCENHGPCSRRVEYRFELGGVAMSAGVEEARDAVLGRVTRFYLERRT